MPHTLSWEGPWQYDKDAIYRGTLNQYIIQVNAIDYYQRIHQYLLKLIFYCKMDLHSQKLLIRREGVGCGFTLPRKPWGTANSQSCGGSTRGVWGHDKRTLTPTLPSPRDVGHQIDLIPGFTLPCLPHYRLSLENPQYYRSRWINYCINSITCT